MKGIRAPRREESEGVTEKKKIERESVRLSE